MPNPLCKQEPFQATRKASNFMETQGPPSSSSSRETIYGLLQACSRRKDLAAGRNVYSLMIIHSLNTVAALADHLIRLFASCGCLTEANQVFSQVANPTVFTWNAIISAHTEFSQGKKALELYAKMQQEGVNPDKVSFLYVLKACIGIRAVEPGKLTHYQIVSFGLDSDVLVGSTLIDMYAKCGCLVEAHRAFIELRHRNCVSWGVLIAGYAQHGHGLFAIHLFESMRQEGIWPDKATFLCVLKACGSVKSVEQGMLIHDQIISLGLELDDFLGNCLVDMYAKCGIMEEAQNVFDNLLNKNAVSWVALISGYAQHADGKFSLELFMKMQLKGILPDRVSFLCVLKASGSLGMAEHGRVIHDQVIKYGFDTDTDIKNTIVHMYTKCASLEEAHVVFELSESQDVVTWGALIAGYAQQGPSFRVLELFKRMQEEGIKPNTYIFSSILMACGSLRALEQGRLIHAQIIINGLELDMVVGNSLIDMYAKCGSINESCNLFYKLSSPDEVSYGALIAGCVQHGHGDLALDLFNEILQEGTNPSKAIFACIVKACGSLGALGECGLMYQQVIESGFESDMVVGSSLVDMYVKRGSLEDAHVVFKTMVERDVVSWGAIIAGYAESENSLPAFELYGKMQQEGVIPSKVIFLYILKACGSIAAVEQGKRIHGEITRSGFESDLLVGSALVYMYAKFGNLEDAQKLFNELPNQDMTSWGSIIMGYAHGGNWRMVGQCLEIIQLHNLKPDDAIYTNILAACSHAGVLDEGLGFFRSMIHEDLKPGMVHYNLLVDLVARAGHLTKALDLLKTMPFLPEAVLWTSLLTGCMVYGNVDLARRCFDEALQLDSNGASGYSLMLNAYADAHMLQVVDKLEGYRKSAVVEKKPGRVWVEVNESVHEVAVKDRNYLASEGVHEKMRRVNRSMKEKGHAPQFDKVLESFTEDGTVGAPLLEQAEQHILTSSPDLVTKDAFDDCCYANEVSCKIKVRDSDLTIDFACNIKTRDCNSMDACVQHILLLSS